MIGVVITPWLSNYLPNLQIEAPDSIKYYEHIY